MQRGSDSMTLKLFLQLKVKPVLREGGPLKVQGGRHPLQELTVNQFISNETDMGGEGSRVHLLTGPNSSGKSVYLKQVQSIVQYCAQQHNRHPLPGWSNSVHGAPGQLGAGLKG